MTVSGFFATDPMQELHRELRQVVLDRHNATPRHQQKALGPSEIGHPCTRHLASAMLDLDGPNPSYDPLPSIIGTATHTWLESAVQLANTNLGRERWLTETKVYPAPWLSGSCDLFDTDTGTAVDWKIPGVNQFTKLKKIMSPTYRIQVHLYGKGFVNLGHNVRSVAVLLIPRGGTLASSVLWSEPYDPEVAAEAIARYELTKTQIKAFDVAGHPERIEWFEKTAYNCIFCKWFSPRPSGPTECPGVDAGVHP